MNVFSGLAIERVAVVTRGPVYSKVEMVNVVASGAEWRMVYVVASAVMACILSGDGADLGDFLDGMRRDLRDTLASEVMRVSASVVRVGVGRMVISGVMWRSCKRLFVGDKNATRAVVGVVDMRTALPVDFGGGE